MVDTVGAPEARQSAVVTLNLGSNVGWYSLEILVPESPIGYHCSHPIEPGKRCTYGKSRLELLHPASGRKIAGYLA